MLIFSKADLENLCPLRCMFLCLEAILGLQTNLTKFELLLVGNLEDVVSNCFSKEPNRLSIILVKKGKRGKVQNGLFIC